MQIREYLKQATTLKKQLMSVSAGSGDNNQNHEQLSKISTLVTHLKEQEMGYMSLLSQLLVSVAAINTFKVLELELLRYG